MSSFDYIKNKKIMPYAWAVKDVISVKRDLG